MKLLIDQGNTRTKMALVDHDNFITSLVSEHLKENKFNDFIKNINIDKVVYATVAQMPPFLEEFCEKNAINIKSLIKKTSDNNNRLNSLYGFYVNLGADLLSTALYAHELGKGSPTLTISVGSCITCVVVKGDGKYMGGAISPGLNMRALALHQYTHALPLVDVNKNVDNKKLTSIRYAKNTKDVILKGIFSGVEGELLNYIGDFNHLYHSGKVFLTGGDAYYFKDLMGVEVVENMVLKGLNLL